MNTEIPQLVTVVIPTYNHAHFLGRALQSILDQTHTNWEAIVVDNHSQDNTEEVVKTFADPRITLLKIHNNGVIAASRNTGIRAAKGEWIAFLDSDDWWTPNKLQVCFKHINDQVDLVYHDLEVVREHPVLFQRKKLKNRQVNKPVLIDLLLNGNTIANSSVVVRKRLLNQIGGIDENTQMIACEDYNAWLRIAEITDAFSRIPECLGYYMVHGQGISRKDMSLPHEYAIANFLALLGDTQRGFVSSVVAYMSGRFHYSNREYDKAAIKFKYCLDNADNRIRLRAAYLYVLSAINKVARPIVGR
jgi:glycosyltransferase involved in cell wall biosynthesis